MLHGQMVQEQDRRADSQFQATRKSVEELISHCHAVVLFCPFVRHPKCNDGNCGVFRMRAKVLAIFVIFP